MAKNIVWDKEEKEEVVITGSRKTGLITATLGDLKIVAKSKLSRKERNLYTKESVSKLDLNYENEGKIKLKDGFDYSDLITSQLSLSMYLEELLYVKAYKGKTEIPVTREFLEEDNEFLDVREELLQVLMEENKLVGKTEE